ncbi:hypothetical protein JWV37_03160 [Sulfurospirillum sp. T05]|uniref:Uncharacterized protein n=1 Tax=Sulfurospirillum tamanense TaxID=2813362 RepID=A0ABS2WQ46_9BACT|nr:hypothetical protein [Sulfurospirillum tamanensis]MBN2963769.1 hypothetical protein [Sulfurospirillum tamanensis]
MKSTLTSSFLKALFAIIAGLILGLSGGKILSGEGARTLNQEIEAIKSFFWR